MLKQQSNELRNDQVLIDFFGMNSNMTERFIIAKARDLDVVVLKENGWINYTKLCTDLTSNNDKFRSLINKNTNLQTLILSHEKISTGEFSGTQITVNKLTELHVLMFFNNIDNKFKGTYGPRYMLDFIIMTCDITYYKLIHDALETIDDYSNVNNSSFKQEIETIKNKYKYKIGYLKQELNNKNIELENKNNELKFKDDKINKLEQSIEELKQINLEQTDILKSIRYNISEITISLNGYKNHTTDNQYCKYKIIFWLNKDDQNKRLNEDVIIQTFIGLNENKPKFKNNELILINTEVSCSLDSFKSALSKLNHYGFTTDRRKITIKRFDLERFIRDFKYQLELINDSMANIQTQLNQLTNRVNNQDQRIETLENNIKQIICNFYNIDDNEYSEILNDNLLFKYRSRWRKINIDKLNNRLYVNFGKNDKERYTLIQDDL